MKDLHKSILEQITKIILDSNCNTYVITGYRFMDVRLVLNFYDCSQVFDFKQYSDSFEVTKFFTKDFEGNEDCVSATEFKQLHTKHKPE